jgi:hypothetical protein
VLEAVFVLLESSSPSRRIFIGSHSLPPLVRRIGPSDVARIEWCGEECEKTFNFFVKMLTHSHIRCYTCGVSTLAKGLKKWLMVVICGGS